MRNADVSNVEALRNYFLGKDPQLKETMADNSLRLIGIPGRNFVLRTELIKAINKLTIELGDESKERKEEDERLQEEISAIEAVMVTQEEAEALLSNYYTKAQVDDIISHINTLKLEVVEELPPIGRTDTIYLVPNGGSSGNVYDEYIYVNNNWELIGTTEVDLSNYYTKDEVDTLIAQIETGLAQEINPLLITDDTVQLNALDTGLYIVPEGLKIHFGRLSNENWIYTAKSDTTISIFETTFNGNTYTHGLLIDGYTDEPTLVAGRRGKSGVQALIGNYIATPLEDAITSISVNGTPQTITNHNVDITVQTYTAGTNVSISNGVISATDTTYENKPASSGGTDVSLVTTGEKYTWNNKGTYSKPSGGIPKTDLDSSVQASLDKADTAIQDISGKQDVLTAGSNITITNNVISATDTTYTAGANITINNGEISATNTTYSAGTNISISSGNVISATDTTYSAFTGTDGTSAGTSGLVPAPATTDADKYLKSDGTWATVSSGTTYTAGANITISANNEISATDTTYSAGTGISISGTNEISTNAQVNTIESISVNNTTVSPDANKNVDITVPTNNNQLTNGAGYQTASDVTTTLDTRFTYGTTDLTPGTSPLAEGNFYFVYE